MPTIRSQYDRAIALGRDRRSVLTTLRQHGYTYMEIGEALGISRQAVSAAVGPGVGGEFGNSHDSPGDVARLWLEFHTDAKKWIDEWRKRH